MEGQRIKFSVSTGSGSLTGCRTDANESWCSQFEGCASILAFAKGCDPHPPKLDVPPVPAACIAKKTVHPPAPSDEIDSQCPPLPSKLKKEPNDVTTPAPPAFASAPTKNSIPTYDEFLM